MLAEGSANKKHLNFTLIVYKPTFFGLMNVSNFSQRGKTTFSVCFEMEFMCYSAAKYRSVLCIS